MASSNNWKIDRVIPGRVCSTSHARNIPLTTKYFLFSLKVAEYYEQTELCTKYQINRPGSLAGQNVGLEYESVLWGTAFWPESIRQHSDPDSIPRTVSMSQLFKGLEISYIYRKTNMVKKTIALFSLVWPLSSGPPWTRKHRTSVSLRLEPIIGPSWSLGPNFESESARPVWYNKATQILRAYPNLIRCCTQWNSIGHDNCEGRYRNCPVN